jgi:ribose transport system substrate-binding protein
MRKDPTERAPAGRRRRAWALAALLAAGLALTLNGVSSGSAVRHAKSNTVTLGLSMPFLSADFEVVMMKRFQAEAGAAGFKLLPPTNANMDSGKQIADVKNLISAGAKALVVIANDSHAIIPALDYAASKHVPVVSVDIGPDGGKVAAIVRADNVGMGAIACQAVAKAIGGTGKVLSLEGAFTSINGRDRTNGFHQCIKKNYPKIDLIEQPTDWDPTKQVADIQTTLTANPDLKAIYMQSDWALSASLNAIKTQGHGAKAGQKGHIYTISIDATPLGLQEIKTGVMDAEISQPLDLYVKYGLQYLDQALGGKAIKVGKTDHGTRIVMFNGNPMDLVPATLVTKSNLSAGNLWANEK